MMIFAHQSPSGGEAQTTELTDDRVFNAGVDYREYT